MRLFRGVNLSGRSKSPPFLPFDDPAPLDQLRAWGFNVLRLLVIWEALEPERGRVDEEYLTAVSRIIDAAEQRGLHVIVDMHQDLYARSLGGDGAPAWATRHEGPPASGPRWFMHYLRSSAVQNNFGDFWRDEDGIKTSYLETMAKLVAWMNRHANVIGYDFFNEPMAPTLDVVSGRFESEILRDFNADCARVLERGQGAPRLQFIEPCPLVAFGVPCRLVHELGPTAVFSPHLYDIGALGIRRYHQRVSTYPRALAEVTDWAAAHDMPVLIGEFGALNSVGRAREMLEDECRMLDRVFASWTAWHFDVVGPEWNDEDASIVEVGGAEREFTVALIRPYPRAIAGTPTRFESKRDRTWTFEYDASGDAVTEVVVPERWGGRRPSFWVDGAEASWSEDEGDLDVLLVRAREGAHVVLTLTER